MGCILHTTNIELRPRLVSLGRFFCSILLGYSLLGISPKPFNLFYCSSRFYEKRPNRSDCLPNYNCAIPTCYIRPCLNWCKIGVIHSAAIPSKYRFPRHYSGLVGSLCIFSAFKYNSHTSFLPEPSLRPPFGLMGIKIDYNYSKKTVGLQLLPGRLLPRFWGAGCKGPSPAHRAKEGPFEKTGAESIRPGFIRV